MNKSEEELFILNAGYNNAISDVLKFFEIYEKIDIKELKEKIKNLKRNTREDLKSEVSDIINFKGILYKYFLKDINVGIMIYKTEFELKGVYLFLDEGKYIELPKAELEFTIENYEPNFKKEFNEKMYMDMQYNEWISKWEKKEAQV